MLLQPMTVQEREALQEAANRLKEYLNSAPGIVDECINTPSPESPFGKEFSDESALTTGSIAAMYLNVALQHLALVNVALSADSLVLLPLVNVLRAAMEASSRAHWLLDPSLDGKQRIAKGLLERIAALESQQSVRRDPNHLSRRAADIRATALRHGIHIQGRRTGSGLPKKIGGESRPTASALAAAALNVRGQRGESATSKPGNTDQCCDSSFSADLSEGRAAGVGGSSSAVGD